MIEFRSLRDLYGKWTSLLNELRVLYFREGDRTNRVQAPIRSASLEHKCARVEIACNQIDVCAVLRLQESLAKYRLEVRVKTKLVREHNSNVALWTQRGLHAQLYPEVGVLAYTGIPLKEETHICNFGCKLDSRQRNVDRLANGEALLVSCFDTESVYFIAVN